MEPTSSPDNGRQSRGLARFWPVHGMPAPVQRQSDEDGEDVEQEAPAAAGTPVAGSAPTDEQPQVDETHPAPSALTSETQMVALGSRRPPEMISGGRAWNGNQGGFPPVESERGYRNGDAGPRHGGGAPAPNGLPPLAGNPLPASRSPFAPNASAANGAGPDPAPFAQTQSQFGSASPFSPVQPPAPV